jgi:hypothetical protein
MKGGIQLDPVGVETWSGNWAWSLPLIVLNVVVHVFGLAFINERLVPILCDAMERRPFVARLAVVMGVTALLATGLHAFEAAAWAIAYRLLGALSDYKSAMLYSLSAITSYCHANLFLEHEWQLMGALEALNGMLLFGLTTAFWFAMIQKVLSLRGRGR